MTWAVKRGGGDRRRVARVGLPFLTAAADLSFSRQKRGGDEKKRTIERKRKGISSKTNDPGPQSREKEGWTNPRVAPSTKDRTRGKMWEKRKKERTGKREDVKVRGLFF